MDGHDERVDREATSEEQQARRDFLKKAGKVAVAAPALALILKAEKAQAWGRDIYGGGKSLTDYFRSHSSNNYSSGQRRRHRH